MLPDVPGFLAEQGYRVEVVPVGDGQFYWHSWRSGHRVNGGLEACEEEAGRAAVRACRLDVTHRGLLLRATGR